MGVKLFITILLLVSFSVNSSADRKSDHFDGKAFYNPQGNNVKTLWDLIEWKWNAHPVLWPENVSNKHYPVPTFSESDKAVVTFINHASFLIQLPGLNVLTDPVFSQRASPLKFAGPKRVRAPGIIIDDLPPIHVVIISHNHYDHLDLESLKLIDEKFHPLFLVPLGDGKLLKSEGLQIVREMDWWEESKIRENIITFAPAQHWSGRKPWDKNESLWGSFMITTPSSKIYFAGDTGYSDHFLQIKSRLGAPDVALLPIGAYKPRYFMKTHHMNPEEALRAHIDLGAATSVGMHFGTFQLSDEGIEEPVSDLRLARKQHQVKEDHFIVLDQGDSIKR